jgi:hypothetical protein
MNNLYGVHKYTYARYCTETDLFKKLPELDPDPEPDPNLEVKFPDPGPAKRSGSGSGSSTFQHDCCKLRQQLKV